MSDEIFHEENDRPTFARGFEGLELAADGRNVELLCVPYGIPTLVADPPPDGDGRPYEESIARGCFDNALRAPNRVLLEFEHFHPGLSGVIGRGDVLDSRDDALYGRFRVYEHPDGDKALAMIHDGVLTAASVFFQPIRSIRTAAGFIRSKAKLDRVAIARSGAYPGARVLAVRTGSVSEDDDGSHVVVEQLPRLGFDPELAAKLEASGLAVPELLRAVE
jgi:HK97 family phage prohead protease